MIFKINQLINVIKSLCNARVTTSNSQSYKQLKMDRKHSSVIIKNQAQLQE